MLAAVLWLQTPFLAQGEPPEGVRGFLEATCFDCHDSEAKKGGLDLSALPFQPDLPDNFRRWVRIHDRVRDGEMPPRALPRPEATASRAFLASLAAPLVAADRARQARSGRSTLRRLNRYEYENALRDLLDAPWLRVKDMLPEDGEANRFNKVGDALDVSHVQLAAYMDAAENALRQVLDSACTKTSAKRYYAREQPAFVERATLKPYNGRPERSTFPMLGTQAQPAVLLLPRQERVRRKLDIDDSDVPAPMTVGVTDAAVRELEAFGTVGGTYTGNSLAFDQFRSVVGGRYRLRCSAFTFWAGPDQRYWWVPDRTKTSPGRRSEPVAFYAGSANGKRKLGSFDVQPEAAVHELEALLLPGETILPDAARLFRSRPPAYHNPLATPEGSPGVAYRWLEVEGPLHEQWPALGYRVLFGELPFTRAVGGQPEVSSEDPAGDARTLLERFLDKAFRRPPRAAEIERLLSVIRGVQDTGGSFTDAMITGYVAVLCSPAFLFLEQHPGELDGDALASRLSLFLWNSPPDDELRTLARSGELKKPETLRQQTDRLLDDPRSARTIDAFLDYWLDLRKVRATAPDAALYPDYYLDDPLFEAAVAETQAFFGALLHEDLPIRNLVAADFVYANERLAEHYGLPPVEGVALQRIQLPADSVRGGILTQASLLKVTANGTTTSPVLRGAWVLERILGQVPMPPPPGLPAIEPDTRGAVTIREQLDKHRASPSCAVCHEKIDPAGLALESFDVMGAWRAEYRALGEGQPVAGWGKNGQRFEFHLAKPVDPSGKLADGRSFGDIREFKRLLLGDERLLADNMVRQWVVFATGASVSFGDRPAVERILDAARASGYGMRTLVHGIVQSELFRWN